MIVVQPLGIDDVIGRERYGRDRDAIRRRVVEYKRSRRVAVGPCLTFVFEDRATVWWQTQEMLWVEHIIDLDAIRAELDVYNALLPAPGELSATLLVEVDDPNAVVATLNRLVGIDEHVVLEIGERTRVRAAFEPDRQTAEKISAVQYVRFPLDAAARGAMAAGAPLALVVDHPAYAARTVLPEPLRASLAAEVADADAAERGLRRVRDGR
jgi:hypothetical protein